MNEWLNFINLTLTLKDKLSLKLPLLKNHNTPPGGGNIPGLCLLFSRKSRYYLLRVVFEAILKFSIRSI